LEGGDRDIFLGTTSIFIWMTWVKPRSYSVEMAGCPAENRSGCVSNTGPLHATRPTKIYYWQSV